MRADHHRRLVELERGVAGSADEHGRTAAWLDWIRAEYAHLVEWDLVERLHAVPVGQRTGVICDWLLDLERVDPAAGAAVVARLEQAAITTPRTDP